MVSDIHSGLSSRLTTRTTPQPCEDAALQGDLGLTVEHDAIEETDEHGIDHPAREPRPVRVKDIREIVGDDPGQHVEPWSEEETAGGDRHARKRDGQHIGDDADAGIGREDHIQCGEQGDPNQRLGPSSSFMLVLNVR